MSMTRIIPADESTLSPSQRGHRYDVGDIIFGVFENTIGGRQSLLVRYDSVHGGFAYVDIRDEPLDTQWDLTSWRYATAGEIDRFDHYFDGDRERDDDGEAAHERMCEDFYGGSSPMTHAERAEVDANSGRRVR